MLTYTTIYQYISNQQTYFKRIIYLRQKYVKSSDSLAFTPPTLYFCISQTGQRMDGLQRALISDIPYSLYCMKTLLLTIKSFNIMKKRLPLITAASCMDTISSYNGKRIRTRESYSRSGY